MSLRVTRSGDEVCASSYAPGPIQKVKLPLRVGCPPPTASAQSLAAFASPSFGVGYKDMEFTEDGDIVVTDPKGERVVVMSARDGSELGVWKEGIVLPVAIAVAGSRAYILNQMAGGVVIYE